MSNSRRIKFILCRVIGMNGDFHSLLLDPINTAIQFIYKQSNENMKLLYRVILLILLITLMGCTGPGRTNLSAVPSIPELHLNSSWQIQYTGVIDTDLDVGIYNLDLFDTSPEMITDLHHRGVFVQCYFSAGSYEDWRSDAVDYPEEVLGKELEGWPGEKWLDIRRLDLLQPIIDKRLDLALNSGCDGVDPDNVDGYVNDTGFPLTADDQLTFNRFLSQSARSRGLAIGLKNDLDQAAELAPYFDWIINEECFYYQECDLLLPFLDQGKPVFIIEYEITPDQFCLQANQLGFNALYKNWELDSFRVDCRQYSEK